MLLPLPPYFPSFSLRPEGSGCASKDSHLATNEHTLNRELIISSLLIESLCPPYNPYNLFIKLHRPLRHKKVAADDA
jgi:hypothetical protein